jgi:hypothetical protein
MGASKQAPTQRPCLHARRSAPPLAPREAHAINQAISLDFVHVFIAEPSTFWDAVNITFILARFSEIVEGGW